MIIHIYIILNCAGADSPSECMIDIKY